MHSGSESRKFSLDDYLTFEGANSGDREKFGHWDKSDFEYEKHIRKEFEQYDANGDGEWEWLSGQERSCPMPCALHPVSCAFCPEPCALAPYLSNPPLPHTLTRSHIYAGSIVLCTIVMN